MIMMLLFLYTAARHQVLFQGVDHVLLPGSNQEELCKQYLFCKFTKHGVDARKKQLAGQIASVAEY